MATSRPPGTRRAGPPGARGSPGAASTRRLARAARQPRARGFAANATASPASAAAGQQAMAPVDKSRLLGFGEQLSADHPGYGDLAYTRRRAAIAQLAHDHRAGEPVPRLEYTPEEQRCWALVLGELQRLYPSHACAPFVENLSRFGFTPDAVPQLEDVSQTLRAATGWQIQPVAGLLHPREFLRGLAARTFHSTQYMRFSKAEHWRYTPEPDVCHELLGHTVMLADPAYAEMVRLIGCASLAADDKQIWHLTRVYWYTVEFGCVREGGEVKAFGAGLLSSVSELQHMRGGSPQLWPFCPAQPQPKMSYKDGVQRGYFVLDSFQDGLRQLRDYCAAITPPELQAQLLGR